MSRLGSNLLKIYGQLDSAFQEKLKGTPVTCPAKGCAACCYQIVGLSVAEAIVIAEHIIAHQSPAEVQAHLEELERRAQAMENDISAWYVKARRACVFLTDVDKTGPWTGMCSIYEARPLACRYQYVVSDPALCALDEVREVLIVDSSEVSLHFMKRISQQNPDLCIYGPMEPFVVAAIRLIRDGIQPQWFELQNWATKLKRNVRRAKAAFEKKMETGDVCSK